LSRGPRVPQLPALMCFFEREQPTERSVLGIKPRMTVEERRRPTSPEADVDGRLRGHDGKEFVWAH
jgi:hypothetical protein